jgi:hypothetical protein
MNIDTSPDSLARMAAQGLPVDPPPTEEQIEKVVRALALVFQANDLDVDGAIRLLHSRFKIRMEIGETIRRDYSPWVDSRRALIDPYYWARYRDLLIGNGWSPRVVHTLNKSMDDLLDLLGNPSTGEPWRRQGLVVGDVQSGKTASYAALICKAADAGYRMVILLTGTLENVRRQTQERLDAAFVGLDSRAFLTKGQLKHKSYIGVGQKDSRRDGIVFTSRDHDFKKDTASQLNISLESVREPVLVVTKKNSKNLSNLATWLRTRNADRQGFIDVPLLLIDDEADNASINTKASMGECTAINAAIRDLMLLFKRSSYVGFTATPFANIFIDPDMAGDLFPKDFIHLLDPPTNYLGMGKLFPSTDPDAKDSTTRSAFLRTIEDSDGWLPVDHKQDVVPGKALPESLLEALRMFFLTTAVRDLRGNSGRHRSMLVNVSRFTIVQDGVAADIQIEVQRMQDAVRLYGRADRAETQSEEIAALKALFDRELSSCGIEWPSILVRLHDSVSPIRVQAVNQRTGAAALDYGASDSGVRVISVGGNSLSRGLTLEGLSISYFLRNSKAYDTLLQMGRWFGYRDNYDDLCRLYLTDEAEGWYRHISEATAELKRDFHRMRRRKATPEEFGLRVRNHPDSLLITARNKMASGVDMDDEVHDVSLAGRGVETSRLYSDRSRNEENLSVVERFFSDVVDQFGRGLNEAHLATRIWRNIPADSVAQLLDQFLVHPLNHDFQGDAIAQFLRKSDSRLDETLSKWTVALPVTGTAAPHTLQCGIELSPKLRKVAVRRMNSLLVSGKSARVGSPTDIRFGLTSDQLQGLERTGQRLHEDDYRGEMDAPLMIVYLIRGVERESRSVDPSPYKGGLLLPALSLHFPGTSNGPDANPRHISYRLNKVAQDERGLLEDFDDLLVDDDAD